MTTRHPTGGSHADATGNPSLQSPLPVPDEEKAAVAVHTENGLAAASQETTVTSTTPDAREKIGTEEDVSKFDFGFLLIPVWCRFNPQKPFHFGLTLTFAFGLTSTFGM